MENDLKKAERILKRLYRLQKKELGDANNDPILIGQLGSAYWWQGENTKALPLIKESVNRYEKIYGESHSFLIQPLINLAMVHFNNKEYEKTDEYLRRSLKIQFKQIISEAP